MAYLATRESKPPVPPGRRFTSPRSRDGCSARNLACGPESLVWSIQCGRPKPAASAICWRSLLIERRWTTKTDVGPLVLLKPMIKRPNVVKPIIKLESMVESQRADASTSTALPIRLDEDWCHFLGTDYVFSNHRLVRSGFDFSYPEFDNGLEETVAWYRAENWI